MSSMVVAVCMDPQSLLELVASGALEPLHTPKTAPTKY